MAGSYDGSIRIDTSINSPPIDNGIAAIENKIKSIGTTIGVFRRERQRRERNR